MELQQKLSPDQVAELYHDEFVQDQARDFGELASPLDNGVVADIGGGVGYFAERIRAVFGSPVRVVVEAVRIGADDPVKLPLRLQLIKAIRRDSFILTPTQAASPISRN